MKKLFTSESVTEGHPDKICDQISDSILDAIIERDPCAHVACECIVTTGMVFVMGEITTECFVDIAHIARRKVIEIGYDRAKYGFDGSSCSVQVSVDEQSPDIARGVNNALEGRSENMMDIGAGDQGMMFGYACDETPEYMPMPIALAHRITRRMAYVRKQGIVDYMRPDGKAQVTVEYDGDTPMRVDTVVLSTQHAPEATHEQIERDMIEHVIRAVIPENLIDASTRFLINPTGRFVVGGPQGDSGLTGARHAAKNLVAAGLAKKCEIQLAYAIGVANPVSIMVDTFGTGALSDSDLAEIVGHTFDFRPAAIIERLDLRRPIYAQVATYGHFGRDDLDLSWEKLDYIDKLKAAALK